jgi:hypothetical protein
MDMHKQLVNKIKMFSILRTKFFILGNDHGSNSDPSDNGWTTHISIKYDLIILKIIGISFFLALDRLVNRGANVVHRLAHKHNQAEPNDETANNRALTTTLSKGPVSPKPPPPAAGWRRSVLVNTTEQESVPINSDPIYNNVANANRTNKKEKPLEDEGDQIEHEILNIVEQEELKEQHRNTPPTLPEKKRTTPMVQENNIDIELDATNKLVHPGIERHIFDLEL